MRPKVRPGPVPPQGPWRDAPERRGIPPPPRLGRRWGRARRARAKRPPVAAAAAAAEKKKKKKKNGRAIYEEKKGASKMLEVRVFVISGCPFCDRAVAQANGVPGVYVRAEEVDPEARERLARETGCRTLPSVWVRGAYIGGLETGPAPFGGLARMVASGQLRKMSEEHARAQRR